VKSSGHCWNIKGDDLGPPIPVEHPSGTANYSMTPTAPHTGPSQESVVPDTKTEPAKMRGYCVVKTDMLIFMVFASVVAILMTGAAILMMVLFCVGMPRMSEEVQVAGAQ